MTIAARTQAIQHKTQFAPDRRRPPLGLLGAGVDLLVCDVPEDGAADSRIPETVPGIEAPRTTDDPTDVIGNSVHVMLIAVGLDPLTSRP
jgi:hypothetical protein